MTEPPPPRCPWCGSRHPQGTVTCPLMGRRLASAAPPPPSSLPPAPEPPTASPNGQGDGSSDAPAGRLLGNRYRVQRLVGLGTCATVYECVQVDNGRVVAVKVIGRELAESKRWVSRFQREIRLTAQLNHANICRIYDSGSLDDGRPYYTMELLDGEPLSSVLERDGALPYLRAIDLTLQLVAGLRVAHDAGIVHRDIKPANIFLTRRHDGRDAVKLLDFGLGKSVGDKEISGRESTQLTLAGTFVGSPFYVAPEQFDGAEVDPAVDLWATGVVLYEMLAGVRPFVALNMPQLLLKIAHNDPPPLERMRPGVPMELVGVVSKALSKDPAMRHRDAVGLLRALLRAREVVVRPPES